MSKVTIYTCDLCKIAKPEKMKEGVIQFVLQCNSGIVYASKTQSKEEYVCDSCLNILSDELEKFFEDTLSKLRKV